tara:strand:- start:364 stop:720 length:357 start_codon:yes stop_codon:yes gene_type:complete
MKLFYFTIMLMALIIAASLLGQNISYKWAVEDQARDLEIAAQEILRLNQEKQSFLDYQRQVDYQEDLETIQEPLNYEDFPIDIPIDEYIPLVEYEPPREPKCLDFIFDKCRLYETTHN